MRTIRVINNTLTVHFEDKLSFFLSYAPPVFTMKINSKNELTFELGPIASGYYQITPSLPEIEKARFLLGHINNVPVGTKTDMHKVLDAFALGKIGTNLIFTFNDCGTFDPDVDVEKCSYSSKLP